ncbi:MAG: hypothetical protein QXN55_06380 [Candidatus Nitrosotenuis sp.]
MSGFVTKQNKFLELEINPLYNIHYEMMFGRENKVQTSIINAYWSLEYTFDFITITIQRILSDIEFNRKYWDLFKYRLRQKIPLASLTAEEKDLALREIEAGNSIFLDASVFYLYAKILMDQIAKLVCAFYGIPPHKSFRKHREFVIKPNFHDVKYKKFIKNMDWFNDLQDIRDDHIIHPFSTTWKYSMSGSTLQSLGKAPIDGKNLMLLINELKIANQEKIPELTNEQNHFLIMETLKKNKEKLSDSDLGKIIKISKKWNENFYSIDELSDKIFEYIDFINSHFVKKKILNPLTQKPLK